MVHNRRESTTTLFASKNHSRLPEYVSQLEDEKSKLGSWERIKAVNILDPI